MVMRHGMPRPEGCITANYAQEDARRLERVLHFICQFDGCTNQCAGNHGPVVTLCFKVHRYRGRQCEKCGRVGHPGDRPYDFQCKLCSHIYCGDCCFL
ncbi:unnamed protein product [Adineta steineri]|uniref:Uncharacterized protein n=1 Tax=Adineta steineri TaxID=433720 RepID=A0A819C858_9BILA|nr:unnamed protein product [Adineta steineri]